MRAVTPAMLVVSSCALAFIGCRSIGPTEIVITVETDLEWETAARRIDEVEIHVMRVVGTLRATDSGPLPDAGPASFECPSASRVAVVSGDHVYSERCRMRYAVPAEARFPITLGVVPEDGDGHAQIYFEVVARLRGAEVARQRGRARFVPNQIVYAIVSLTGDCVGIPCDPETTCRAGRCVPVEVPDGGLPPDGGCPTCADAGPAPVDAGPGDAGPTCGDRACNGSETCTSCEMDCGACGPVCGDGSCDGSETCDSCRDCQNGHLGTRPFMEPCDSSLNGVWRCVTSNGGPCDGSRVSERCQGGVWAIWSCNPANCSRCVCTGFLDPYCMDAA